MQREEAIQRIIQEGLKDFPLSDRIEIVDLHFLFEYDKGDEAIANLSPDLQQELCSGKQQYPSDDKRYDPLILHKLEGRFYGATNAYVLEKIQVIDPTVTNIGGEPDSLLPCPCCAYLTLNAHGQYDICEVCFWEDDGAREPDDYSGPNHMTLGQGRHNFKKIGACDKAMLKNIAPNGTRKYHHASDET